MVFDLADKIALVTGASRGIGLAIAQQLAQAGALVICVSRTPSAIEKAAADINAAGFKAEAFTCDVSQLQSVDKLVKSLIERHGRIDILVNNAGITRDTLLLRMSEDDWDTVLNINLKGAFNCVKSVTRPMMKQRSGRIINISSIVGLIGNAGQVNYAASKAGLIGLTKAAAKELAARGITVNCIAPGYIETDMTTNLPEKSRETLLKQIPLGRIGKAQDIAVMVHFLASDEANYITGQTFTVDGGMVMN
ncbi:MAG: 3-oxoacyl-[acyl-carrier-protein] reductase [FCB group bacterium]|nr:3-oxoacyl-[acyl-carrier-protein] reductase [FCB group bacterium]